MTGKIRRHGFSVRFVHWTVAISIILLTFSGFGQMPMYRRYMIDRIPGLGWSGDFANTLILHYLAAALLLLVVVYHVVYHGLRREFDILPRRGDLKQSYLIIRAMLTGKPEPPSDKYLAEQRLAYAYIAFWIAVTGITGIFKVLKNLPAISFNPHFLLWITNLHTFATFMLLFGVLAHLAAFIFKANRPLFKGMLTGFVPEEYARHRHPLWYQRLSQKQVKKKMTNKNQEMPLNGHLAELRRVIIISAITVATLALVIFIGISGRLLQLLITPLQVLSLPVIATRVGEAFFTRLKLSFLAALILAAPVVFWQVAGFIFPALTREEKKLLLFCTPTAILLFTVGIFFAYKIVFPTTLYFLIFAMGNGLQPMLTVKEYFSFVIAFFLPFGLGFEIPLLVYLLARWRLLSSRFLIHQWRKAFLLAFIAAAALTPSSDILSQVLLAVPIIILYLFSIGIALLVEKKRLAAAGNEPAAATPLNTA